MFPKYREIQRPLLQELIRRGGSAKPTQVDSDGWTLYEAVAKHFNLSDADLAATVAERSGTAQRSKWQNMVRWARNDLRKAGHLRSSRYGEWTVTDEGWGFVNSRPPS